MEQSELKSRNQSNVFLFFFVWVTFSPHRQDSPEVKTSSPSTSRHASFDSDQVSKDFVDFLKSMQRPGREIHKQCRSFLLSMSSKKVIASWGVGVGGVLP